MMKLFSALLLTCICSVALADVSDLIAEAESLQGQARSIHNAWVPTARLITAAKKAQKAGDASAAATAAERAIMLAKASLAQAESEKKNWKNRLLVK